MADNAFNMRYGRVSDLDFPKSEAGGNIECIETLLRHTSIRNFDKRPVADETIACAVSAAQSASTSSTLQPWSLIVIRDEVRKRRIAELANHQQYVADCPLFLVWVVDQYRLRNLAADAALELEGLDYLDAFLEGVVDTAIAAQNAAAAFEAMGLGVVYIGAIRDDAATVAAELKLPKTAVALLGMCVGYPVAGSLREIKPRLPQDVVVHSETYDVTRGNVEAIADYEAVLAKFYNTQGLNRPTWRQQSFKRLKDGAALHGRERLREALHAMDFQLR